jgi:FkbM family methyltransferase
MSIKSAFRELVGAPTYSKVSLLKKSGTYKEQILKIGRFNVAFPPGHILPQIFEGQTKRNLALGIAAREISKIYRQRSILDIGANVGDTAALIATYSDAPLTLVEPSDIYFEFLKRNAAALPNRTTLHKEFVFSGPRSGTLVHRAGTAWFDGSSSETATIVGKPMSDFGNPALIKIDTDGFDFEIISSNSEWLSQNTPALYFENSIYNHAALDEANSTVDLLSNIGYVNFHVFSATGTHICSTDDIAAIKDLNKFLCASSMNGNEYNLFYYDILCFSLRDTAISDNVSSHFRAT